MKILHYIQNRGMGGVEQCAVDYTKCLSKNENYKQSIVLPSKDGYYEKFIPENIKIYKLNTISPITIFLKLLQIYLFNKPKVIISHGSRGAMIFHILNWMFFFTKSVKIIGVDHGTNVRKFLKYNKANACFCVNNNELNLVSDVKKNLEKKKLKTYLFPNLIKLEENYHKKKDKDTYNLGILARFQIRQKGFDILANAVKILKDRNIMVNCIIGGDGIEKDKFIEIIERLDIKNQFTLKGWVDDKKSFFEEIDIYCMLSQIETFGISYIEAMKYSTPCIAGDTFGTRDIFKNEVNGIIVPMENREKVPELLAEQIIRLINDSELRNKLAKNAFDKVKKEYSFEAGYERFQKVFKDLKLIN